MNIFPFRTNKMLDEFSMSLAEEFIKIYTSEAGKSSKKREIKIAKANTALSSKIDKFKTENKLGVYKKARIGNKFMWFLREQGIEKELAEEVTRKLLFKLNEK